MALPGRRAGNGWARGGRTHRAAHRPRRFPGQRPSAAYGSSEGATLPKHTHITAHPTYDFIRERSIASDKYRLSGALATERGTIMRQASMRGVQQSDIDSAADALLAEQVRPTIE